MEKSKLNRAVCNILFIVIFIEKMCIQVYAAELELEPNTYKDGNPFQFEISETWTSKGQTIHSYDVSEYGQIAIVFSDNTIGVFDHDMNFLYQLSFKTDGKAGALWLNESLLFIDFRSDTAIVCDEDGHPKHFYDITGPINYGYRVVDERARYQGTDEYYCVKKGGSNDPLIHYGFYTMLKRLSENGKEEVLYESDETSDTRFMGNWVFIIGVLILVVLFQNFRRKDI